MTGLNSKHRELEVEKAQTNARLAKVEAERNTWRTKELELRDDVDRLRTAVSRLHEQPEPSIQAAGLDALVKDLGRMVDDKKLKKTLTTLAAAIVDPQTMEFFRLSVDDFFEYTKRKLSRLDEDAQRVEMVIPRKVEIVPSRVSASCQTDDSSIQDMQKKNAKLTALVKDLRTQLEVLSLTKRGSVAPSPVRPSAHIPAEPIRSTTPLDYGFNSSFQDVAWPRRLNLANDSTEYPVRRVLNTSLLLGGRRVEESSEGSLRITANLEWNIFCYKN